jgi:hypothetical protein
MLGAYKSAQPHILHPKYYSEDVTGMHPVWNNIFLGQVINPKIRAIYGDQVVRESIPQTAPFGSHRWRERLRPFDQDGYSAAFKWLTDHGESEFSLFTFKPDEKVDVNVFFWFQKKAGWPHDLKARGYRPVNVASEFKWRKFDGIMGEVVKELICSYPFQVMITTFIIKPILFIWFYVFYFIKNINLFFILLSLATTFCLTALLKDVPSQQLRVFMAFVCGVFTVSMVPLLLIYPDTYCMSEQVLLFSMCILSAGMWWAVSRFRVMMANAR